jgi:HK97 gp10 family phage protein
MPIKSRLVTKGFEEYLEKLAKAGQDIDEITDEALVAGGEVLVAGMKRRAPVMTGTLKARILCSAPRRVGTIHFVRIGPDLGDELANYGVDMPGRPARRQKKGHGQKNWKTWGRQYLYFIYQEYGTSDTPPHPYIRPTFDHDMRAAQAAMRRVFEARGAL